MSEHADPPAGRLARYKSNKRVHAGEILSITPEGCEVRNADGSSSFRRFRDGMCANYPPRRGDFWAVYDDGFVMIWPAWAFLALDGGFEPAGE